MSLAARIIIRLSITAVLAGAVAYGWLYIKQSRVELYLRERTLVRQAQEISSFVLQSPDGSIYLNMPSELSEAYNSPDSRFRYAVRDEAGRIVASSGRRVGPLPTFFDLQDRHIYRYPRGCRFRHARRCSTAHHRKEGPVYPGRTDRTDDAVVERVGVQ